MATPVCKDCIQAAALDVRASSSASPCDGLIVNFTAAAGRTGTSETVVLKPVDNPSSVLGYDFVFDSAESGDTYNLILSGGQWIVLNSRGEKVFYSTATGSNNNACPPFTGWTSITGEFADFSVTRETVPGPSDPCSVTNGTFDSNATGWTVTNGTWDSFSGGSVKFDSALLGTLSQANVLTVGETYDISFNYYTSTRAGFCTPTQIEAAYIKVYAGTKVYTAPLEDNFGTIKTLQVELTCETNATLKIEIFDPNQCFGTVAGGKGRYIDEVCAVLKTNVTDPTGPSPLAKVEYRDMAEVPAQVNGVDYNTKLDQYQECLATKGTTFYNKIAGAVKCDHRELSKLKLIIELLGQKNEDRSLDCIYDKSSFPTVLYPEPPCNITIPFIEGGSNVIVLDGDYSQFETFTFETFSPAGYAVATGNIIYFTNPAYFYTNPGEIGFDPTGYYYSLSNALTIQPIDDNAPFDVFNPLPITTFLPGMPIPPASTGDIVVSGTVISEFGLLTPANNTQYTIYDPGAPGETFSATIIDAVYDPVTDTTTITLSEVFPGDAAGSTLCIKQNKEDTNNYLETFINFANQFCADCIVTGPAPTPTAPTRPDLDIQPLPLSGESGEPITTEFNQQITF